MGEEPSSKEEKPQDSPPKPHTDDDLEEEDFDFFIKDLQRIIDESPPAPGMQSQFARTISYLKEKKKTLKALGKLMVNEEKQEIYRKVLKLVDGEIETQVYSEDRFQNVLQLVKMREELSERKAAETPKMPEKVFTKNGAIATSPISNPTNLTLAEKQALSVSSTLSGVKSVVPNTNKLDIKTEIKVEEIKKECIPSDISASNQNTLINDFFSAINDVILMGEAIQSKKENKSEMTGSSIDNALNIGHE